MTVDADRTDDAVIIAEGLNYSYGSGTLTKQILFDVTFSLDRGEIVLLTGPSGSGKTTLLTLIGALRTVQEGRLQVLDWSLDQLSGRELVPVRREIGFIFQQHNLLPFMTALQNVELMFALDPDVTASEARERSVAALVQVGLGDRVNYEPGGLSGGQKQRVAVARALVLQPHLVLADEPTAALDSKSGRDVVDLLQGLAKERGVPILMVTHDSRVLDVADRIVEMEDGRLRLTSNRSAASVRASKRRPN